MTVDCWANTLLSQLQGVITATHEGIKTDGWMVKNHFCLSARFRNVYRQETDFLRGYAAGFGASKKMDYDYPTGEASYNNF